MSGTDAIQYSIAIFILVIAILVAISALKKTP